ncbi:MAG: EF-hand domain-containing protein [Pseudomonadota bacterium]|nr:EF-hand domain-containing protein [Pseudomonadota bacterium]
MRPALLLFAFAVAAPATARDIAQVQSVTLPEKKDIGSRPPAATMVFDPAATFIAGCDGDGDGRTSRAELTACVARTFAAIDTGHTGSIGYVGYSDWAARWLGDANALPSPFTIDTDGDNRITLAEMQAEFASLFAGYDKDKDGAVTRADLLSIRSNTATPDPGRRKR